MHYYLVDTWDVSLRESEDGGYSRAARLGKRVLEPLPRCPRCGSYVWSQATRSPFSVRFTGRRIGDAAFDLGTTLIVSGRFVQSWQDATLSGLSFSAEPIQSRFRRDADFTAASTTFFGAYPTPRFVRLAPESGVSFLEHPECDHCTAGLVADIGRVLFREASDLPDLFLPSALPGWLVASERTFALAEGACLTNLAFFEGFRREDWHRPRKGYWSLTGNGRMERREEVAFLHSASG